MKMRKFVTFITAVCVLFLIKLRWPRNKSLYDKVELSFRFPLSRSARLLSKLELSKSAS